MKKIMLMLMLIIMLFVVDTMGDGLLNKPPKQNNFEIIYNNVWGSIYHPVSNQCDDSPTITGDGSKINVNKASEHRWIAISQEMLDSEYRVKILNDSTSSLYRGELRYGDTVWIESPHNEINGAWVVRDSKNKRYRKSIDFLQTVGDGTLYNNNKLWNGRFDSIKILKRR